MKQRLFTIKEVALQTGLSTQLIRKWEERYEAVKPQRMANGYRGYSREDIETLSWLKSQVDAGVPIGMAVKELDGQGLQALAQAVDSEKWPVWTSTSVITEDMATDWKEPVQRLLQHFEQLDLNGAQQFYEKMLASHHMEHILMNILEPALVELGERWARGEISEYQEHFGSHFIRDKMLALRNLFRPSSDSPLLVTACGPGERHEMGILFLGFFALQQGYRVVYLGTSPSEKGILDCLQDMKPHAFVFSFAIYERFVNAVPFLLQLDAAAQAASPLTQIFVGGRGVKETGVLNGSKQVILMSGDVRSSIELIQERLKTQRLAAD